MMLSSTWLILATIAASLGHITYTLFRRRHSWSFLLKGRQMIRDKAKTAGDTPFSFPIFGYGERFHVVSTEQHWADLKHAGVGHLSLHHWVKGMFQPQYTLIDEWPDNRADEGMPIIRAIRTMSNCLPEMKERVLEMVREEIDDAISSAPKTNDFAKVFLQPTLERLMVRINTFFVLGEDAANDADLITRGISYTKEVTIIGELVRLVPTWLASSVAALIKRRNKNQKYALKTMVQLVEKRMRAKDGTKGNSLAKAKTVLDEFVDYSPDHWTTRDIVHHLNILWTTTTLSLGIVTTQFIQDLYAHSTHHPTLTQEISASPISPSSTTIDPTPVLEGFLMESMRTNSFQSTAVHRTALEPFTFSDGYTIPQGESVQFNQEKVHFDAKRYERPNEFDPCRYRNSRRAATDIGMEWPFWGVGKFACPGRFYFSYTVKLLASCLLTEYEGELEHSEGLNFTWGENNVPNPRNVLLLRRKLDREN